MKEKIVIKFAETAGDLDLVYDIRAEVFVTEQGVPLDHERDSIDRQATHVLAWLDGQAIGTARTFTLPESPLRAWVGRIAVRKSARHQGAASRLLEALIALCRAKKFESIHLHAQSYVTELYRRHGFQALGECFMEEGIEHLEMVLKL